MHTLGCEMFNKIQGANIASGTTYKEQFLKYSNVPCFVECRFTLSAAPAGGSIRVANALDNGNQNVFGAGVTARTFTEVAEDFNDFGTSGFIIELPQGIGQGIAISNKLGVDMTNVFVAFKNKVVVTTDFEGVKDHKQ